MCELMALSFEDPVVADFSLREFAARGEENPDGWGLGWYPDQAVAIVKGPVRWGASHHAGFLAADPSLRSRTFLAHVRHKTVGGAPTHADTHPFARELGGRDYCFAHNGTLDDRALALPLGAYRPVGGTDSERYFCHLLGQIAERGGPLDSEADWRWLHESLAAANRLGKLNVLLSDGRRLFVYHDVNGWKGLNFREIHVREGRPRHFADDSLAVDVAGQPGNRGFVVATCPLGGPGWHTFQLGELIVLDRGRMAFSSHRDARGVGLAPGSVLAGR